MPNLNPFLPFLERQGYVVLDGGLATALEANGFDLNSDLWSTRLLLDEPEAIQAVHVDYIESGADCITTASYQASVPGLVAAGVEEDAAVRALELSSTLALKARDAVWDKWSGVSAAGGTMKREGDRQRPLVAASVGPYGAYLADGSEYRGRYGVTAETLDRFHRDRFRLLARSGVDLLACETIPDADETGVLLDVLDATPDTWAWFSFSCRDGGHLADGTAIEHVVRACSGHERVAAVGVNCTRPAFVPELIERSRSVTDLPLILYPNSGEQYDARTRDWLAPEEADEDPWLPALLSSMDKGARVVGGCCRIGPTQIGELRKHLESGDWSPAEGGDAHG